MNEGQLSTNENIMSLLKARDYDQESLENLLDKLADNYDSWVLEWAQKAFSMDDIKIKWA